MQHHKAPATRRGFCRYPCRISLTPSSRPKRVARSGEIPALALALVFVVALAVLAVIPAGNLLLHPYSVSSSTAATFASFAARLQKILNALTFRSAKFGCTGAVIAKKSARSTSSSQNAGRASAFSGTISTCDISRCFKCRIKNPLAGVAPNLVSSGYPPTRLRRILTLVPEVASPHLHILNRILRNPRQNRRRDRSRIMRHHIRNHHAPQSPRPHRLLWPAIPLIQPQKKRRIHRVPHRDVRDRDVFHISPIAGLKRYPLRPLAHAVRNRDIPEPAIRLRPALDPSIARNMYIVPKLLPRPRHHRPQLIGSRHKTIRNRHIIRRPRLPQRIARLRTDRIIPRRVHRAVTHPHIPAAIDIEPIPVRIHQHVIDRQVIHARSQQRKVPSLQHREIPQQHIPAILQRNRFIPHSSLLRRKRLVPRPANRSRLAAMRQPPAPYQPRPNNRNPIQPLAIKQRIPPVVMPIILERFPRRIRLRRIIRSPAIPRSLTHLRRIRRHNHAPPRQKNLHLALQPNRKTNISPRRKHQRPTPHGSHSLQRPIHRPRSQRRLI